MANDRLAAVCIMVLAGLVSAAEEAPTNDKVLKFCKDNLGKKVGAGECYDLAAAALKHAGAKPQSEFKDAPKTDDYVWGKLVYTLEMKGASQKETKVPKLSVQPGDVIQFGDATFEGKNLRGFENYSTSFPHHTAVVLDVKKADNVVTALEQNVNGQRIVTENAYRLTDLKTGWVRVYRTVPH